MKLGPTLLTWPALITLSLPLVTLSVEAVELQPSLKSALKLKATVSEEPSTRATTAATTAAAAADALFALERGGESENREARMATELGGIRNALFPIKSEELVKFLLLGSIKFFVILALVLTRDNKDAMVVTQCGAEAIAVLKIYGVLPAATLFIGVYSKMATVLSKKQLFYATAVPFFVFFFLFDAFIYPNRASIQPSIESVQSLLGIDGGAPGLLSIFANLVANWTSAVFYIVAEVYSSASIGILFWTYANDVVSVPQAERFYPLFSQMSGLAPIVAGQFVVHYASRAKDFGESLHRITQLVTLSGGMICFFYWRSNLYIESIDPGPREDVSVPRPKKSKPKLTMIESARFLASSEYLRLISCLVVGYGLSINFTDIVWKSTVKKQYPDPLDYQRFMGNFSTAVGASTMVVIVLGVHLIRIMGWRAGALATPIVMGVLAAPFFGSILAGLDSPRTLKIAVTCGTIQTLLSRTAKYALFDPTTQVGGGDTRQCF